MHQFSPSPSGVGLPLAPFGEWGCSPTGLGWGSRHEVRGGKVCAFDKIASRTPSILSSTSALEKRRTHSPYGSNSRSFSRSRSRSCVSPSTSIAKPIAGQKKSTMRPPIKACRRNFQPPSCELDKWRQRRISNSVGSRRIFRACLASFGSNLGILPHPNPVGLQPHSPNGAKGSPTPEGEGLIYALLARVRFRNTSSRSASRVTTSTMPYPSFCTAASTSPAFTLSLA